jgi:hypothetical protein
MRDGNILQGSEFGQEVMELENEADMVITEGCQFFTGKLVDTLFIEPDRAFISLIKGSKDMQQGTFTRPGRAHDTHDLAFA